MSDLAGFQAEVEAAPDALKDMASPRIPRFRPLEDLLLAEPAIAGSPSLWRLPPPSPSDSSHQCGASSATRRLELLLAEPWVYTISRLLLQEDSAHIGELCRLFGLRSPSASELERGHWTVAAVRAVYEPALLRTVTELLEANAAPDGVEEGRSPLMHCAMEGLKGTASALLQARADVGRRDAAGRTALHYAAIQQESFVAALLLRARADPHIADRADFHPSGIARLHGVDLRAVLSEEGSAQKRARHFPLWSPADVCNHVVTAVCSPELAARFLINFASQRRPLLLRRPPAEVQGACWRPRLVVDGGPWSPEALIERAGADSADVGAIPYGDDFGCREQPRSMTLRRFLEIEVGLFSASGHPLYFFTFVEARSQPALAELIHAELDGLPERLPPPFRGLRATALQFAVGGMGSGSPPHFHDDAFNVLLAGQKRWWLWPPSRAAMSRVHPSQLVRGENGDVDIEGSVEVVQEPGDILYVPSGWGHAVLNTAERTVCVAVEFGA